MIKLYYGKLLIRYIKILTLANKWLEKYSTIDKSWELFNIMVLLRKINTVDGWLTKSEGIFLFMLAKNGPGYGEIVEISSFKGLSTIWLAKGSQLSKREVITAIDPHTGSPEHQEGGNLKDYMPNEGTTFPIFLKNIDDFGINNIVNPLKMTSEDAFINWNKPIRLLFIDGNHDYSYVKKDYILWESHLIDGGIIAFHDTEWEGPGKIIAEYIRNSEKFREVIRVDGLTIAKKVK